MFIVLSIALYPNFQSISLSLTLSLPLGHLLTFALPHYNYLWHHNIIYVYRLAREKDAMLSL